MHAHGQAGGAQWIELLVAALTSRRGAATELLAPLLVRVRLRLRANPNPNPNPNPNFNLRSSTLSCRLGREVGSAWLGTR